MPGPVSHQADVRRRIIEVLITIAPDAPFPIKLIKDVISADSMIGGPAEIVLDNLAIAGPAALRGLQRLGIPDEIIQDRDRRTLTITAEGQHILREQLRGLPPTPQAKQRRKLGLDDLTAELLIDMYHYASYIRGVVSEDGLTPDQLALLVPHYFHLSQVKIANPDGDWGTAQELATLWLLNDHGIVPEAALVEHTQALVVVCERYYRGWGWEGASMLLQAVEEMINTSWSEVEIVGGRLLDMADELLPRVDEEEQRKHYQDDAQDLRRKLTASPKR